jgi:hypothetical protein
MRTGGANEAGSGRVSSVTREHLRRGLEAHLTELGYSGVRVRRGANPEPEILRISPTRGRLAYAETVLRRDLSSRRCHERLVHFSQRRTRRRSSILFFIGVAEADVEELISLLERLAIRSAVRGGHVHVVPIAPPARRSTAKPKTR